MCLLVLVFSNFERSTKEQSSPRMRFKRAEGCLTGRKAVDCITRRELHMSLLYLYLYINISINTDTNSTRPAELMNNHHGVLNRYRISIGLTSAQGTTIATTQY
ncbi:hypothetical protein TWF506_000675 [Arthrobotrys conoides]|uniref:Uncharacterized protein n=1 Tax=Arthrobotrys conoides TaxID=74498 RepID=A0AAN8NRF7_9PEZI